jgi:two-component system NtrC family sensor kinase
LPQAASSGDPADGSQRAPGGGTIRLLHILLIAAVIVPLAVFAGASWFDWSEVRSQATLQATRTAQILREHAIKVFESHEFALDLIDDRIRGLDWAAIRDSSEVQQFLARIVSRQYLVNSIALVAPDGQVASVSTAFPTPPLDMTDRDYFRAALSGDRHTYISPAGQGRLTGTQVVVVSRPRATADGRFDGVIAVAVSIERFSQFYRDTVALDQNSVTLARADGAVLVREPRATAGATVLTPRSGFVRSIATGNPIYRTVGELDGVERLHALQKVGPYPVYVSFGLSFGSLRATWLRDILVYALFAVGGSVGLCAVGGLALRRARNEQALVAQWQDEVRRRESAENALRQTQKMEALGQLTGGVAHDFNNLLMVITGNLEMLKRKAVNAGLDRQIGAIEHAARNGEALTRKLLAFSRRRLAKAAAIELAPFVAKAVDLLRPSLPADIRIEVEMPAALWPVHADADDLELCLVNIVINARDAMPNGGAVFISAQNRTLHADDAATDHLAGDFVAFSIRDTGTGIPPEHLSRVFEPFFTTKEVGRGTGLGLSQAYGFAKQSGGAVTIESAPGQGTTVTLFLARGAAASQPAEDAASLPAQPGRVLLVEDNADVAEATVAMLESLGCTVTHASAAEPALDLLAAGAKVDLVVSDIMMPGGLDGMALARTLRSRYPALPVLLVTGYSQAAQKATGETFPILLKPYQIDALRSAIGEALSAGAASR